jgi:nucleotide-binding universal stress UspA family protein
MKVLIALDATPSCGQIVTNVAARLWPAGTVFLLLHVLDPFPFTKAPLLLQRAKEAAEKELTEAGRRLCGGGWGVEARVIFGHARREIARAASSWKADLVVVGSNEAGTLVRVLLGSTARAVLHQVRCSVEVVRPSEEEQQAMQDRGMKVLVATDGSEYSLIALKSVASRPWPEGTQFKVLSIPEPFLPPGSRSFPEFGLEEIQSLNTAALKDAKRHADAGAELLHKAGLQASTETPLPYDSEAREIVKEAERWQARMVVVGSHGRRGFDRLMLGSVSENVALHAPCSVEVIRGLLSEKAKSKRIRRKE